MGTHIVDTILFMCTHKCSIQIQPFKTVSEAAKWQLNWSLDLYIERSIHALIMKYSNTVTCNGAFAFETTVGHYHCVIIYNYIYYERKSNIYPYILLTKAGSVSILIRLSRLEWGVNVINGFCDTAIVYSHWLFKLS